MEAARVAGDLHIGAVVIHAVDGKARPHPSRPRARNRATASPTGVTTTVPSLRGAAITLWFHEEVLAGWRATGGKGLTL